MQPSAVQHLELLQFEPMITNSFMVLNLLDDATFVDHLHIQGYGCLSSIDTSSCRFHFSLKSLNHTMLMPGLSSWQGHVMLCYVWTFMWCTAHLSEDVTLYLTLTSAVLCTLLLFVFHSDCFYSCSCCHTNPSQQAICYVKIPRIQVLELKAKDSGLRTWRNIWGTSQSKQEA